MCSQFRSLGPAPIYPALDSLADQLAEMVEKLTPLTSVKMGAMVVARFTEYWQLYTTLKDQSDLHHQHAGHLLVH